MSGQIANDEEVLEAAIRVATEETGGELPQDRADAVLRKVRAEIATPKRAVRWWYAAPFVPVAAAIAMLVVAPSRPEPSLLVAPVAKLQYLGGEATRDPLKGLERITLGEGDRLDVAMPAGRASLIGPLAASFTEDAVILERGRGVFSIDPRPADRAPFVVRAPDGEVIVHGTMFSVSVDAGSLGEVAVEHGRVEVRRKDKKTIFVGDRQKAGPESAIDEAVVLQASFEGAWWQTDHPRGYVAIESDPLGATVSIGGIAVGRSPLLVAWPIGQAKVSLERDGYVGSITEVAITEAAPARVTAKLERAIAEAPIEVDEVESITPKEHASRKRATKLLDAGRCAALDREVERLLPSAGSSKVKSRLEVMVAECWLRKGERRRALDRFVKVADRHPSTKSGEGARYEVAKLEEELGQKDAALGSLDAYLSRYPGGRFAEPALLRRCELLVRFQRLSEAEACLERFQAKHPTAIRSNPAVLLSADLARVRGRHADASALYRRYLDNVTTGEGNERAHYALIECLIALHDPGAKPMMVEFLAKFPNNPRADSVRRWYSR